MFPTRLCLVLLCFVVLHPQVSFITAASPTIVLEWGSNNGIDSRSMHLPIRRSGVLPASPKSAFYAPGCPVIVTTDGSIWTTPSQGLQFYAGDSPAIIGRRWIFDNEFVAWKQSLSDGSTPVAVAANGRSTIPATFDQFILSSSGKLFTRIYEPNQSPIPEYVSNFTLFDSSQLSMPTDNSFLSLETMATGLALRSSSGYIYLHADGCISRSVSLAFRDPIDGLPILAPSDTFKISSYGTTVMAILNTDLWFWGSDNNNNTGLGTVTCAAPQRLTLSEVAPANAQWTHVSVSNGPTLVVASDGTAVLLGGFNDNQPMRISDAITQLLQGTSPLSQISSTSSGHLLLLTDGSVWVWTFNPMLPGLVSGLDLPGSSINPGPWRLPMEHAVPSNYRVTRLVSYDGTMALAEPISETNVDIPSLETTGILLAYWQPSDRPTATLFELMSSLDQIFTFNASIGYPDYSNIHKVSLGDSRQLFLTVNGSVLYGGTSSSSGLYETSLSTASSFQLLDQRLLLDEAAKDIAAGTTDSLVLMSNGSILAWGTTVVGTPANTLSSTTKRDNTAGSTWAAPDPIDYTSAVMIHPPYLNAPFSAIHVWLQTFGAIDNSGRISLWGKLGSNQGVSPIPLDNLFARYKQYSPLQFCLNDSGFTAVMQSRVTGQLALIQGNYTVNPDWTNLNDTVIGYTVVDVSTTNLTVSSVLQLSCSRTLTLITTATQIYGLGEIPSGMTGFPDNVISTQIPLAMNWTGYEVGALAKTAIIENAVYVQSTNGKLWAMCGVDGLTLCRTNNQFVPILSDYTVLSIFSATTYKAVLFRPAIVANSKRTLMRDFSKPKFLHLMFGPDAIYSVSGTTRLSTSDDIYLLKDEHPVASPTAQQITHGAFGVLFDEGFLGGAVPTNVSVPRRAIRWGTAATQVTVLLTEAWQPSYLPATLMENSLVKIIPTMFDNLFFYRDCSMRLIRGPDGGGDLFEQSFADAALVVDDTSYNNYSFVFKTELVTERTYGSTLYAKCQELGSTIVDVACSDIYHPLSDSPLLNYWCVQLSSANNLFVSSVFAPTYTPYAGLCTYGMLGSISDCNTNTELFGMGLYGYQALLNKSSSFTLSTITSFALGQFHGVILTDDNFIGTWGLNDYGQLGISPQTLNLTETISLYVALPFKANKVLAFGKTSMAIGSKRIVTWGSNLFGQLGNGASPQSMAFTSNAVDVLLPAQNFKDVQCSLFSCFVLYPSGVIYSWGATEKMGLGRPTSSYFDSVPAPATALVFPGPARIVTQIFTSAYSSSVLVRGEIDNSAQCSGSPPDSTSFTCINGIWVSTGTITIPTGTTVVISGPSVINGDLSVPNGATIIIGFQNNALNVTGCFLVNGTIIVALTAEDIASLNTQPYKSRQLNLISASCVSGTGLTTVAVTTPPLGCQKLHVNRDESVQNGYSALFRLDDSHCKKSNTWWIILVSVLGGLVLLVAILALLVTFTPLKRIVRPFTKREEAKPRNLA